MHKAWRSTEEVPYCFSRSSIKFQGHRDWKIDDLNPILNKITRLVRAIKSIRYALFWFKPNFVVIMNYTPNNYLRCEYPSRPLIYNIKFCLTSFHVVALCKQDRNHCLTHWGRDKMDAISQTTFSNALSSMKMFQFRLKLHWSLYPRVQFTIFHNWFR